MFLQPSARGQRTPNAEMVFGCLAAFSPEQNYSVISPDITVESTTESRTFALLFRPFLCSKNHLAKFSEMCRTKNFFWAVGPICNASVGDKTPSEKLPWREVGDNLSSKLQN